MVTPDLVGGLVAHVGEGGGDELPSQLVEVGVVVRGKCDFVGGMA